MTKGIVFDLDGTLYDSDGMDKANKIAIVQAIAMSQGVDDDRARAILEHAIGEYSVGGGRPSLYGTALRLGVPDACIEHMQSKTIDPLSILDADIGLSDEIRRLSTLRVLALLTNTRTVIAYKALEALRIDANFFSLIRGGEMLEQPKPSIENLLEVCRDLNLEPSDCTSVGDRWDVDLAPAKAIGMKTRKVEGRDDLYLWIKAITQ